MQHVRMNSRGLAWFLALAVLALTAAVATADSAPSKASEASAQETPATVEPGAPATAEPATEAPEGNEEWPLVDEDSGRRYRIETLPKVEGAYQLFDDGKTVLLPLGAKFEVVRQDDKTFWVKYYEPQTREAREIVKPTKKGPTPEELAAIAASYEFDLPVGHRLRYDAFDHGLPRSGQWRNGFDVADMNEDGHPDIVFGPSRKGGEHPNIFLGDGQGGWRTWKEAVFPDLGYDYGDAEAADWNGDGHLDVAFGVHLRGILLLVGDGKGKFEPWSEGIAFDRPGEGGEISAFSSRAIDAVDWNGDGKLDLIALGEGPKGRGLGGPRQPNQMVDSSRGFLVYLNRGDGTWQPWRPLQNSDNVRPNFGDDFVMVDLDHDGDLDLASSSRQMGSQEILDVATGRGVANEVALPLVRKRALVSAVATAELDGNEYPDLIVGYTNREAGIWRTGLDVLYGGEGLTWTRRPLFNEESRRDIAAVATGDLDGDGHPDLVATTGEGEVLVFLGDGQGFFVREDVKLMPTESGCTGSALRLEDLDGDGRDEIIAGFAGEPEGFLNMPGLTVQGCTGHGSLRVWKVSTLPAS